MNYKLPNKNDTSLGAYIIAVIIILALAFGISCLFAWIGMLLWNWVIVGELGLFATKIGFWPMWGLVELCSILFKTHNYNSNND
jgi:hypothetical protein